MFWHKTGTHVLSLPLTPPSDVRRPPSDVPRAARAFTRYTEFMAGDRLEISSSLSIPLSEFDFQFSRSGGKGGQNVNKVETKVELLFDVAHSSSLNETQRRRIYERLGGRIDNAGVLHLVSDESRSQAMNRDLVLERFRRLVQQALIPPKKRIATRPTKGSRERRIDAKKLAGRKKANRRWRPD